MITCPNCNHQNPEGAVQCEACYTPLPSLVDCPNCGSPVQTNVSFCGQCGADLRRHPAPGSESATVDVSSEHSAPDGGLDDEVEIPDLLPPDPLIAIDPAMDPIMNPAGDPVPGQAEGVTPAPSGPAAEPASELSPPAPQEPPQPTEPPSQPPRPMPSSATQLQVSQARLLHVQTDTPIELPRQRSVIRIGKANDRRPPDIDVSGFPNSEIVSRVHANLRVEGDVYYLEDIGSSNGTYVNNLPLPCGNRHRLRPGDRFSLGKGDKVSFIFQES